MESRNTLVSFLQAFGIVLVVLGHSIDKAPTPLFLYTWIYSFHMPLFMFISGFLLQYGNERKGITLAGTPLCGRKGFVWKKTKRLLVPYVAVSTLAFFPKALLSRFAMRPVDFSLAGYARQLAYPDDNAIKFFWFLPTLFLIFLAAAYGARLLKGLDRPAWHAALLALLLALHWFNPLKGVGLLNLAGAANYLFYFFLGFFCCRYRAVERLAYSPRLTALSFALSLALAATAAKSVLAAVNGIALSILLGRTYLKRQWRFLHHLFGASYAIYLFSWFPQVASLQVFLGVTHAPWQAGGALAFAGGLYVPWLVYRWIMKHKETRWGKLVAFLAGQ